MSECRYQGTLGPGGLVRDERLLKEIQETRPLPPTSLRRLAEYFIAYPTNRPLGEHLALIALTRIVGDPEIKHAVRSVVTRQNVAVGKPPATAADAAEWEDIPEFTPEGRERSDDPFLSFEERWVPLHSFDLGLLIEAPPHKKGSKPEYYVIGVSPNPDSLKD